MSVAAHSPTQSPTITPKGIESKRREVDYEELGKQTAENLNKVEQILQTHIQEKETSEQARLVHHLDTDTTHRLLRGNRKMSEFLHHLANEPSIGLYHVSDHVRRTVPKTVDLKKTLKATCKAVEDLHYDMDYTMRTVESLNELQSFKNMNGLLKQATNILEMIAKRIPATQQVDQSASPLQSRDSNSDLPKISNNLTTATSGTTTTVTMTTTTKILVPDEEEPTDVSTSSAPVPVGNFQSDSSLQPPAQLQPTQGSSSESSGSFSAIPSLTANTEISIAIQKKKKKQKKPKQQNPSNSDLAFKSF